MVSTDTSLFSIPCRRFDQAGDKDPRLMATLSRLAELGVGDARQHLLSFYDHNDRLWATWRDEQSRSALSNTLDLAWRDSGGVHQPVHLLNVDEDIEFDEDDLDSSDPN